MVMNTVIMDIIKNSFKQNNLFLVIFSNFSNEASGFSAMAQNPEFMAAIGKSFASQTATLSRMVEDDKDEDDIEMVFECATCHFIMNEENMSYSDNTCPHCGSTMYRYKQ